MTIMESETRAIQYLSLDEEAGSLGLDVSEFFLFIGCGNKVWRLIS